MANETARVRLIDPNGGRLVPALGCDVQAGAEVDAPIDVAERLLLTPSIWAPVDKAAKDIVRRIETPETKEA